MKLENSEVKIDLSENDMKNLQKNYQKINNEENKNKWLDLIAMKVQLGTLTPDDVSKELLDEVKSLNGDNIKDKEYEETFNSIFQGVLENYAKNIKPENFDEKTMQTLYENNYKGEFSTPLIAQLYTRYCNEQEQNEKIESQENIINQNTQDIKKKDATIANQSNEIENKEKTIEEQKQDIKNKDEIIEKQDKQIEQQNEQIENQEKIIEDQKKQLEQVEQQKSVADNEIERLKNMVKELEMKNQTQKNVIEGLVEKTKSLEDVIKRQQEYIKTIMENIKEIKSSINDFVNNLKPKNLKDRIISKFTKEKDSLMNRQKNEIVELICEVEQEGTKFNMLQSGDVKSTEEYLEDYRQEPQNDINKNYRGNDDYVR